MPAGMDRVPDTTAPSSVLEKEWKLVDTCFEHLKSCPKQTPAYYSDLYTAVYRICTAPPASAQTYKLYNKYREGVEGCLISKVLPSLNQKTGAPLLIEFVQEWSDHKTMVKTISYCFGHLTQVHVTARAEPSLKSVAYICFRESIFETVKEQVKNAVILLVNEEREGLLLETKLVQDVLDAVEELSLDKAYGYTIELIDCLTGNTATYYRSKAENWIIQESCPDYMIKAEKCLKHEEENVCRYLELSTRQKMLQIAERELLVANESFLLENEGSGFPVLLRSNKFSDLSRMCKLLGLDVVSTRFKKYILDEANDLVEKYSGSANHEIFVLKLIDLHQSCLEHITNSFKEELQFHNVLVDALEIVCDTALSNKGISELLASFCHNCLKKKCDSFDNSMDKVVELMTHVKDKDIFAEFYRRKLAVRLLYPGMNDEQLDIEKNMVLKLRNKFGFFYTSKMEGMLTNIVSRKEEQSSFESFIRQDNLNPGIDLGVSILSAGCWPMSKNSDINLPPEMIKCVEVFKKYYDTKTSHRKLTWIHSSGICTVTGHFNVKPIDLVVTTHQAVLLVLFNESPRLSFSEIETQLSLSRSEVSALLDSLSCGKYMILKKDPATTSTVADVVYEFNSAFTNTKRKLKIPPPVPCIVERAEVKEQVSKDRVAIIDARLVRIMKLHKVMEESKLISECVQQLCDRFKPDISVVKRCIQDLILREYLERGKEKQTIINYLP